MGHYCIDESAVKGYREKKGRLKRANPDRLLFHSAFNIGQCFLRNRSKRTAQADRPMNNLQRFCIASLIGQSLRQVI